MTVGVHFILFKLLPPFGKIHAYMSEPKGANFFRLMGLVSESNLFRLERNPPSPSEHTGRLLWLYATYCTAQGQKPAGVFAAYLHAEALSVMVRFLLSTLLFFFGQYGGDTSWRVLCSFKWLSIT